MDLCGRQTYTKSLLCNAKKAPPQGWAFSRITARLTARAAWPDVDAMALRFLFERELFRKPLHTFRDHALPAGAGADHERVVAVFRHPPPQILIRPVGQHGVERLLELRVAGGDLRPQLLGS